MVTPKKLDQRAEFYHQLGTMTEAGLSLTESLHSLARARRGRHFGQPVQRLIDGLEGGETFAEAASGIRGWLPTFDLALIDSGERSGRLDVCLRLLAEFYRQRAAAVREVIRYLVYPVLVLHALILLGPFPQLFLSGEIGPYLRQIGSLLVPLYASILIVAYLAQGSHGRWVRSLLERVFGVIPFLGAGRRALALSRLCLALEALLAAGTQMSSAWRLAAEASGSPVLEREVANYPERLEGGRSPGELLEQSRVFPDLFVSLYAGGESSGRLDENLERLRKHYQEEGFGKLRLFASWLPRLIYFGVILLVAHRILSFYQAYFNSVMDASDF